ncbi:MAG: LysM peptidoglycan-binding domain-containing protein [Roseovarius sp.]|uniref:LysM peptidoglycan-binding domain-containing protein n=1 Tax=Roseovarius sp. TaxID=1486281 RepID=UPI001B597C91|nr:LysM domain-containing protein [Roseovarius sp.]MBQ0750605.1 LysM peptidoglycan-binding domain-containing protein [Roseovarius sp.]MBQ0811098.1 LysM peptidoglycan-binding domain-containing protein [Roseovarius sp.]
MLRATLIAAGFVAITLALILIQPGKPRPVADLPPLSDSDVTRTAPDLSALNPTAPASDPLVNSAALAAQPALPAPALPTAPQIPAAMPVGPALESMVLGALQQGQSEGYIDALVNDAAKKGKVEVPQGLVTAEGRVDTALLLSALSQPARPRVPNSYTVATGDSLASIAYRFYGDFARQADILAANADTMQPTDRLRVGQVLNLPTP